MKFEKNTTIPAPTSLELKDFNEEYEIELPNDYCNFLEIGNCGVPIKKVFNHKSNELLILRFLCVVDDNDLFPEICDFDIGVVMAQIEDRLTNDENKTGADILPIAYLFGGDFVCLDFRQDPVNPNIVYWDHNQSAPISPYTENITDNFTNFLNMLYEPKDD